MGDSPRYQPDRDASCLLKNTQRQFPHQRLAVCRSFTCDNQVCVLCQTTEVERVEQQLNTRPTISMEVLHEGVTQSAGSTCTRFLRTVIAQ